MLKPTTVTWGLVIFGLATCLPLFVAQLTLLIDPKGKKAKDLLIGKGQDWRDESHFRTAYALAWADWLVFLPLLLTGTIGVLLGRFWGYVLWGVAGAISLYINLALWILEKEYVYPSVGPLRYYTYYWGFFVYWGALSLLYSLYRISELVVS